MNVPPLRTVFERLSDSLAAHRRSQPVGRRLTMSFLAMGSGENSERGIAAWIDEPRWRLKRVFGFWRDDVPSYSTIQGALQAVDGAELESELVAWINQVQAATSHTPWAGLAIDGRSDPARVRPWRRSRGHGGRSNCGGTTAEGRLHATNATACCRCPRPPARSAGLVEPSHGCSSGTEEDRAGRVVHTPML